VQAVQEAISVVGELHDSLWWFLHAPALPLKLWPLLRDMRLSLAQVFDQLFGADEAFTSAVNRRRRASGSICGSCTSGSAMPSRSSNRSKSSGSALKPEPVSEHEPRERQGVGLATERIWLFS
jgi:hypothetical protein